MLPTKSSDVLSKKKGNYISLYILFCMDLNTDTSRENNLGVFKNKC